MKKHSDTTPQFLPRMSSPPIPTPESSGSSGTVRTRRRGTVVASRPRTRGAGVAGRRPSRSSRRATLQPTSSGASETWTVNPSGGGTKRPSRRPPGSLTRTGSSRQAVRRRMSALPEDPILLAHHPAASSHSPPPAPRRKSAQPPPPGPKPKPQPTPEPAPIPPTIEEHPAPPPHEPPVEETRESVKREVVAEEGGGIRGAEDGGRGEEEKSTPPPPLSSTSEARSLPSTSESTAKAIAILVKRHKEQLAAANAALTVALESAKVREEERVKELERAAKEEVRKWEAKFAEMEARAEQAEMEKEVVGEELKRVKTSVEEKGIKGEEELREALARAEAAEDRVAVVTEELAMASSSTAQNSALLREREQDLAQLAGHLQELDDAMEQSKLAQEEEMGRREEAEKEVEELKQRIGTMEKAAETIKQERLDAMERASEAADDLIKARSEVDELRAKWKRLQRSNAQLEAKLQTARVLLARPQKGSNKTAETVGEEAHLMELLTGVPATLTKARRRPRRRRHSVDHLRPKRLEHSFAERRRTAEASGEELRAILAKATEANLSSLGDAVQRVSSVLTGHSSPPPSPSPPRALTALTILSTPARPAVDDPEREGKRDLGEGGEGEGGVVEEGGGEGGVGGGGVGEGEEEEGGKGREWGMMRFISVSLEAELRRKKLQLAFWKLHPVGSHQRVDEQQKSLRKQLEEERDVRRRLSDEVTNAQLELVRVEEALEMEKVRGESAREALRKAEGMCASLRAQIAVDASHAPTTEEEKAETAEVIAGVDGELDEIVRLQSLLHGRKVQLDLAKERARKLTEEKVGLVTELEKKEQQFVDEREKKERAEEEIEELRAEVEVLEEEVKGLRETALDAVSHGRRAEALDTKDRFTQTPLSLQSLVSATKGATESIVAATSAALALCDTATSSPSLLSALWENAAEGRDMPPGVKAVLQVLRTRVDEAREEGKRDAVDIARGEFADIVKREEDRVEGLTTALEEEGKEWREKVDALRKQLQEEVSKANAIQAQLTEVRSALERTQAMSVLETERWELVLEEEKAKQVRLAKEREATAEECERLQGKVAKLEEEVKVLEGRRVPTRKPPKLPPPSLRASPPPPPKQDE